MNCAGCGVEVDPSREQVNLAVDQVLEASLKDAQKKGGVCPLCGHSKEIPYSNRKSTLFALLLIALMVAVSVSITVYISRQTARSKAANEALLKLNRNPALMQLVGAPLILGPNIQGEVKQDETGWSEAHLSFFVTGPKGTALIRAVGGHGVGDWSFTTLEATVAAQHKKADLITGRIVEYDPAAYVDVHLQAAAQPEYAPIQLAAPQMDGNFPCVFATLGGKSGSPQLGQCSIAVPMSDSSSVDRYEVDLRYGAFMTRQTDLMLADAINVPLTRIYNSYDWIHPKREHAFGRNTNHLFDIAPVGTRNPYTYQLIVLGDGNWLRGDRISKGTGYADAVFQHSETSTSFYGAITQWDGKGWRTRLKDGSTIFFPESYNATNMAQGAAWEMTDKDGNKLLLVRDGKRDLQSVRAPRGGSIAFHYDSESRITRSEDSEGHWATYQYNSGGLLADVALSSGIKRHYSYQGDLMTSISDEHGQLLVQNFYGNRYSWNMLDHQQTDAGTYWYDYQVSPNTYYATRVTIKFPDGSLKTVEPARSVPSQIKELK